MAAALAPFGWTCGEDFWKRYHSDAWVFNLANAVERLSNGARLAEAEALLRQGRYCLISQHKDKALADRIDAFLAAGGDPDA